MLLIMHSPVQTTISKTGPNFEEMISYKVGLVNLF